MTSARQRNEPSPTIVGPRPEGAGGGGRAVPRGMEQLLILAGASPEWRERILAAPVGAADEAGIELSASERAILASIPHSTLEQMADSLASQHGRPVLGKAAAGVAAAALLATGLSGCGDDEHQWSFGNRTDLPPPRAASVAAPLGAIAPLQPPERYPLIGATAQEPPAKEAPAVEWQATLDAALALAKKESRVVMAVFPHPKPGDRVPKEYPPTKGLTADEPQPTIEEKSQKVVLTDSREFRTAVAGAQLVAVKVIMPPEPPGELKRKDEERHQKAMDAWLEAQRKCKLLGTWDEEARKLGEEMKGAGKPPAAKAQSRLPAVVFLAPDGSVLSTLRQPDEEAKLIEAVRAVPGQLAKWKADQVKAAEKK